MTRNQFVRKMSKIKQQSNEGIMSGVCHLMSDFLGAEAYDFFQSCYKPHEKGELNRAYFFNFGVEQHYYIPEKERLQNRLNAILLFEQQVLAFELYQEF